MRWSCGGVVMLLLVGVLEVGERGSSIIFSFYLSCKLLRFLGACCLTCSRQALCFSLAVPIETLYLQVFFN